jgi:DNA-binding transcriptional LysR family regulator
VAPPDFLVVASYEDALARIARGTGICVAPARSDLPCWPGVETVPLVGFENVRTGLVWSPASPAADIERLVAALAP